MQLSPYLAFNGTCEEALNFYKDIFDGEIVGLMRFGDSPMEISDDAKNRQSLPSRNASKMRMVPIPYRR